jgi:hypothetical protein
LKDAKELTVMLLGPGGFLDFRKKVKRELNKKGYNVIIMEELRGKKTESGLDEKLERIMKKYDSLIIAFFHNKAKSMESVIFEIGCICCMYGCKEIGGRLRFLSDKKYEWDKRTAYMNTLFSRVIKDEFDETKRYYKASKRIENFVAAILNLYS